MISTLSEDQANWLVTADPQTFRLRRYGDSLARRCLTAGLIEADECGECRLTLLGFCIARKIQAVDAAPMLAAA